MNTLLIDIGNSRIKWTLASRNELVRDVQSSEHAQFPQAMSAWAGQICAPDRVRLVSVIEHSVISQVSDWVAEHWGVPVQRVRTPNSGHGGGVHIGYDQPEELGVDRWLAMVGARVRALLPACVIDAGSAITFDFINENAQHQGGLIMAGLLAQQAGLRAITPELPAVDFRPGPSASGTNAPVFAKNTRAALYSGGVYATAAALDALVCNANNAQQMACQVVLTGGDAVEIAEAMRCESTIHPNLVLEGLAALS